MDHGSSAPTAWFLLATDEDGDVVVADEHYRPNELVSHHAAEVLRRRRPSNNGGRPPACGWWERQRQGWGEQGWEDNRVYGDPSVHASQGLSTRWGRAASVATEYRENDVRLVSANNDRAAGHARLLELIRPDWERLFPSWHGRAGERGAPRLFIFDTCTNLIEQIQAAPTEDEGVQAGQAVSGKWESSHGHAHAAARYGVLAWPGASKLPRPEDVEPDDPRAALLWRVERQRNERHERRRRSYAY